MTEEMRAQIEEGYKKMQELDEMIKSKAKVGIVTRPNSLKESSWREKQVAKDLKHDRIHRESGFSTPANSVSGRESQVSGQSVAGAEDDDDMDDLELKSIHSLDTRTFITEPKIGARLKVGRDALNEKSENSKL